MLVLEFDEVFWDEKADLINYISDHEGHWASTLNIYKSTGKKFLKMFNAGSAAITHAEMNDEEVVESAMVALRNMYGEDIPEPIAFARSNWSKELHIGFSYATIPPGCNAKECDEIAEPISKKLWFAGEHTHLEFLGTVHGAYMTGEKAAYEILEENQLAGI